MIIKRAIYNNHNDNWIKINFMSHILDNQLKVLSLCPYNFFFLLLKLYLKNNYQSYLQLNKTQIVQ